MVVELPSWRAAAWLRIPVQLWQIDEEGWITKNDQIRAEITKTELTEADEKAIVEELGHIATARAEQVGLTPREAEVMHWVIQGKRDCDTDEPEYEETKAWLEANSPPRQRKF